MSNSVWDNQSNLIPITFGVTGHRDILKEDLARAENCIERTILSYRYRFPRSPFIFLSPLAEGADCIAAKSALETDQNTFLFVVMPFNKAEYRKTISDDWHSLFDELLNHERCIEVVIIDEGTKLTSQRKDYAYKNTGEFVAIHSHVLFALKNSAPQNKVGGTAEIVEFRKRGCVNLDDIDVNNIRCAEDGLVYEINVRRSYENELVFPAEKNDKYYVTPTAQNQYRTINAKKALGVQKTKKPVNIISRFTKKILKSTDNDTTADHIEKLNQAIFNLVKDRDCLNKTDSHTQKTRLITDDLAVKIKSHYIFFLKYVFYFALLAGLLQGFESLLEHVVVFERSPFLKYIFLAFVFILWGYAKFNNYKNDFESYRSLSEALKVQDYWFLSEIKKSPADHFLAAQVGELSWVRRALRTIWLLDFNNLKHNIYSPKDRLAVYAKLHKDWIEDQKSNFLETRIKECIEKNETYERIAKILIYATFSLFILSLEPIGLKLGIAEDILKILKEISGTSLILFGLCKAYLEVHAFDVFIKRYQASYHVYAQCDNIYQHITQDTVTSPIGHESVLSAESKIKSLYKILGESYLDEVSDWYIANTRLVFKPPTGGG